MIDRRNMLLLLLFSIQTTLYCVEGTRWILLGGYTGSELQPNTQPSDTVELVTLEQESQYSDPRDFTSFTTIFVPILV